MSDEFKLCFVDGNWAWFTTAPLHQQWGDDWDDAPYEHNAGFPYEWRPDCEIPEYRILKVAWDGSFIEPSFEHINSSFSVRDINNRIIPWLRPSYGSDFKDVIYAGDNLDNFIKIIEIGKGKVYIPA